MLPSGFLVLTALLPVLSVNWPGPISRRTTPLLPGRDAPELASIDSSWLWTHQGTSGTMNWYTRNTWDNRSVFRLLVSVLPAGLCPDVNGKYYLRNTLSKT
ncbi:hypothetical protein B0H14DRAFT_2643482 [Mycena olivaceomarginata]|nr:hypothetical protein B0H14DRAFT_2643482 [Mycena olivaceomarginata]